MPKILRYSLFTLCLFILTSTKAFGQTQESYSLLLRGVSMKAALEELVAQTQIDLVYASDLIEGKRVFCSKRDAEVEALLLCILENSGLDFIRSSAGTYILIDQLQKPALYGNLAGSITDVDTGSPLPFANILLADGSSGTTSNQDGFFSFKSLISGLQQVVVTYVGYETVVDSIWIEPGANSRVSIELKSSETSVGPIVIDGLEQRLPSRTLGRAALKQASMVGISYAGTPDVMKGASRLAGVAVQQPLAGIQIQGGISNEHVTLLDGVPIRDPVTLGRHLGAFSPLALNRMTVYKAGFGAAQGSHLTGIVALDQDLATTYPYSASIILDPVSLNAQSKGRFQLKGDAEGVLMAAVRLSNWDVYQDRGVQALLENWNNIDPFLTQLWSGEQVTSTSLNKHSQNPTVSFSDIHFASRLDLDPFHKLSGSFYRASNRINSDLVAINSLVAPTNDLFVITDDRYSWLNWAGQGKHSWLLNSQSALATQIKLSSHNSRYSYRASRDSIASEPSYSQIEQVAVASKSTLEQAVSSLERNFIQELSLGTTFSHSFSAFHHTDIGLEATLINTKFDYQSAFVAPIRHRINTSNFTGFIQDQIALDAYTTIEPSIRLTYIPLHRQFYAEPRLSFRYDDVHPQLGNYAFRLAGGLYRQYVNQYDLTSFGTTSAAPSILFWLPIDETLTPPSAYHLAFDFLLSPNNAWRMNFEAFAKWQRVLTLDYAGLQQFSTDDNPQLLTNVPQALFISRAKGRSLGGSLQIERKGEIFNIRAGYNYVKAIQQFPGRFNDEQIAVPWNTPNRINVDTQARLSENVKLEANWTSQWGRQWSLRRAYYDFLAFRSLSVSIDPFNLNTPLSHNVPAYQRLDLGTTVSFFSDRVQTNIQFFVINALDHQNVYDHVLTFSDGNSGASPRNLPGRQYTLSVRVDY